MKNKSVILAFVAMFGLSLPVMAQTPEPSPSPAPQASQPAPSPTPEATPAPSAPALPSTFTLTVDMNDLNTLSTALNELPKKIADPMIAKFNAQIAQQSQPKK